MSLILRQKLFSENLQIKNSYYQLYKLSSKYYFQIKISSWKLAFMRKFYI